MDHFDARRELDLLGVSSKGLLIPVLGISSKGLLISGTPSLK